MPKLKTIQVGDLAVSGTHAGKACFARKGYRWRSRAKQPNGRRKMVPSFVPGDPLPPGMREC